MKKIVIEELLSQEFDVPDEMTESEIIEKYRNEGLTLDGASCVEAKFCVLDADGQLTNWIWMS